MLAAVASDQTFFRDASEILPSLYLHNLTKRSSSKIWTLNHILKESFCVIFFAVMLQSTFQGNKMAQWATAYVLKSWEFQGLSSSIQHSLLWSTTVKKVYQEDVCVSVCLCVCEKKEQDGRFRKQGLLFTISLRNEFGRPRSPPLFLFFPSPLF